MTHLIRENAVERFETSNVDMIEELHVMLAAQHDAPPIQLEPGLLTPQPAAPRSLLARWFSPDVERDLAA